MKVNNNKKGFKMRALTKEASVTIIEAYKSGLKPKQISDMTGLAYSHVYTKVNIYNKTGSVGTRFGKLKLDNEGESKLAYHITERQRKQLQSVFYTPETISKPAPMPYEPKTYTDGTQRLKDKFTLTLDEMKKEFRSDYKQFKTDIIKLIEKNNDTNASNARFLDNKLTKFELDIDSINHMPKQALQNNDLSETRIINSIKKENKSDFEQLKTEINDIINKFIYIIDPIKQDIQRNKTSLEDDQEEIKKELVHIKYDVTGNKNKLSLITVIAYTNLVITCLILGRSFL